MKIESRELEMMGATVKQVNAYVDSDPMTICREDDGSYSVSGIIEADGLTAQGVLDILEALADADMED